MANEKQGMEPAYDAVIPGPVRYCDGLSPNAKLLCRRGAESISGAEKDLFAILLHIGRQLSYSRRLSDAVYADHKNDGWMGIEL